MLKTKSNLSKTLFFFKRLSRNLRKLMLCTPGILSDINPVIYLTLKLKLTTHIYLMINLMVSLINGLEMLT